MSIMSYKDKSLIKRSAAITDFPKPLPVKTKYPRIALVGNPNCGKTTLFNFLTGNCQYVGNWPGVTVELKEGRIKNWNTPIDVVDLPGIYSLSPYSPEEIITRNYLKDSNPDIVVNIVDATNIERNLYLTTQLMELECKVILALNMSDLLAKKGKHINYHVLERELGVPVIPISARKGAGVNRLIKEVSKLILHNQIRTHTSIYSPEIEGAIHSISTVIKEKDNKNLRFKSIKVFEDDPLTISELKLNTVNIKKIENICINLYKGKDMDRDIIIADQRYKYIFGLCEKSVINLPGQISFSEKIDKLLTGKFTSIPIFFFLISAIFFITFGPIGLFFKSIAEEFINSGIKSTVSQTLDYLHASIWSKNLILDAVIGGVGAVISFLPQVLILFTLLSLLEDSGYMARAAFIMDKLLKKIGLSGRAFIPLLMGFGCSVPAILGTRILEDKKDKRLTIFIIPFMSCSAKMPLYLLFASSFFPHNTMPVILSLYIFGIILGILSAFIFKDTIFKGESSHFVMEIPEYRMPSLKNLCMHVWDRVKDFIERAGTVILGATIIIWFLQSFSMNFKPVSNNSQSILAYIGNIIAPAFNICGFGDWRAAVSLLTGLIAKESIVSTISVLYNPSGSGELSQILLQIFSPCAAYAFMVFVLLYTPCVAAVSAIHKELGCLRLTILSIIYQIFISFLISALVFQIGTLLSKIF